MKARRLIIRIAAVLVLVVIGVIMSIIGRGHTIYLDNKTLEYDGQTYKAPYKVTITVGGEELTSCTTRSAAPPPAWARPSP